MKLINMGRNKNNEEKEVGETAESVSCLWLDQEKEKAGAGKRQGSPQSVPGGTVAFTLL